MSQHNKVAASLPANPFGRFPPPSTSSEVANLDLSSAEESSPRDPPHNARRTRNGHRTGGRQLKYATLEVSNDERGEAETTQNDHQGLAEDAAVVRPSSDKDGGEGGGGFGGGGSLPSSVDDNEDPGLFGPGGLLSLPKVAALLLLVWVAQVGMILDVGA